MAMAIFSIAAISLAQAINVIGLTVTESIEEAELREQLRAVLLEATRVPNLREETRELNPNEAGIAFRIEVEGLNLENREAVALSDLFEVRVTAFRSGGPRGTETLDTASTWVYSGMFR